MNPSRDDRGSDLIGVMAAFLVLTWVSVSLRCFVRTRIIMAWGAEDWLMVVSLAIFTLYGIFAFVAVHNGLGKHNKSRPQAQEIRAMKYQALATAIYIVDMAFIKLSIAVFLLRLSVKCHWEWALKTSMAIVSVWTATIFLFDLLECRPIESQWDYTVEGGTCMPGSSLVNAAYAFSVLSILSDWFYALLPIPMLWSVRMQVQMKIALVAVFGLGIFASIATIIRIKYLIDLVNTDDILFASTDAMIWTIIEPGLGITAASVVTLRPLLRTLRTVGSNTGGFASSGNNLSTGSRGRQLNRVPVPENIEHQLSILSVSRGDPRRRNSVAERMGGGARTLGNSRNEGGQAVNGYGTASGSQDFILVPSLSLTNTTDTPSELESDCDVVTNIDLEAGQVVNP